MCHRDLPPQASAAATRMVRAMHPVEAYLAELRDIRASGAAVPETSGYGPLATLLNEVGGT